MIACSPLLKTPAIMNMSPMVITQGGEVLGLGRIAISKDLSISNVLFVEALSFNLISIAQLCDLGLTCTFDKNGVVATLEEDKSLVFMGFRHGNIYLVDFSSKQTSSMT